MSLAVTLKLLSTLLIAAMAVCVRLVSSEVPLGQIVFFRGLFALPLLLAYLAWCGELRQGLVTHRSRDHAVRALFGCSALVLSFAAIMLLPLSLAIALGFLAPVFTAAAAVSFLREPLRLGVIAAIVIGLVGALTILAPSLQHASPANGFALGVLCGIAAAVLTAAALAQMKRLTKTEPAGAIAFYFTLGCTVVGLFSLPFGWSSLSVSSLLLLVACGAIGAAGHIAMTEATARAPASALAAYDYAVIVWAAAFDYLLVAHVPDAMQVGGLLLIIASAAVLPLTRRAA